MVEIVEGGGKNIFFFNLSLPFSCVSVTLSANPPAETRLKET